MVKRLTLILCALIISAGPTTQPAGMEPQCRAVAEKWRERLDAEKFDVVVSAPYVIAGNGGRASLEAYRDRTILAAHRALGKTYFKTPVDRPILILLFNDAASYQRLAKQWFGYDDVPHYGFYRQHDNTMLMNITTGGGTLVHELTHALIAADFADVPDWFNEGFASLYEQCNIDRDTITGLPNWRLPALQQAIGAGKLPSLVEMMEDDDFRNDARVGLNYAQARYLMLYLQQRNQLRDFYTAFRDNHAHDPTGVETFKKLIGPQSVEAFEKEWRAWVLTLRTR